MKRCVVTNVRITTNDKKENVVYVTMYDMGNIAKDGKVYSPKKEDAVKFAFANQTYSPEKYDKYCKLNLLSLVDVLFDVNPFNDKVYVADIYLAFDSGLSTDVIYTKVENKK